MENPKLEFVDYRAAEGVGVLTMNRPPVNVINIPMLRELQQAIDAAAGDPELRVLQLRAEGKFFSAGVDVADHTAERVEEMIQLIDQLCISLAEFPVPTLAVVQGHALGGGCELVMCCDMAWMAEGATIGQPEIKLAVFAPIGSLRLPSVVGPRWAAYLLFSGEAIDAVTAESIGLCNGALPAEELEEQVTRVTAQLADLSASASRLNKQSYLTSTRGWREPLGEIERLYLEELMALHDPHEGLEAFMDKRQPVWQHK